MSLNPSLSLQLLQLSPMKAKAPKIERTKTEIFVRNGEIHHAKRTIPKPKHWSHISKAEGRKGKAKAARKVKLRSVFWHPSNIIDLLLTNKAGTPECRWSISTHLPFRNLTSRDVCYVLAGLHVADRNASAGNIEITLNEDERILVIEDCSQWIKTDAKDEMNPEICNS